jgi:hypothetical protein
LRADGSYVRAYRTNGSRNGRRFSAQDCFIDLAEGKLREKSTRAVKLVGDGVERRTEAAA